MGNSYASLQTIAATMIKRSGCKVAIARDGVTIARVYAVTVPSEDQYVSDSPASSTIGGTSTMYIAGGSKLTILPGDIVTYKTLSVSVVSVQQIQPDLTTTVYYKVIVS